MHYKQGVGAVAALLFASALTTGCGDSGAENVFLYIINGYPGTQRMDILGPGGSIATGVEFGDRLAADGPCAPGESCIPIEIDRSFGTNFTYRLESMTQPVDVELDLFAMYPQETGTLVVNRRSGTPEVQVQLLRHVQTISSDCSIAFTNGLALSNEFLPEGFNNFSIVPEFRFENVEDLLYLNEAEVPFRTECGALPTGTPEHEELARLDFQDTVRANPWFLPVQCTTSNDETALCFQWGLPLADGRSRITGEGEVLLGRTTAEYYQCIAGAITIKQPEDEMNPLPFPDADAQVQCPDEPLTWDDVQVDPLQAAACNDPSSGSVELLEPAGENEQYVLSALGGDDFLCDSEFRVRNVGQDIIFGPESGSTPGYHQNGAPVVSDVDIPPGSQHFWVLLGRPVNPIIWQWDSGETFVDLRDFPYPNDQDDRIGDYDSN